MEEEERVKPCIFNSVVPVSLEDDLGSTTGRRETRREMLITSFATLLVYSI